MLGFHLWGTSVCNIIKAWATYQKLGFCLLGEKTVAKRVVKFRTCLDPRNHTIQPLISQASHQRVDLASVTRLLSGRPRPGSGLWCPFWHLPSRPVLSVTSGGGDLRGFHFSASAFSCLS